MTASKLVGSNFFDSQINLLNAIILMKSVHNLIILVNAVRRNNTTVKDKMTAMHRSRYSFSTF